MQQEASGQIMPGFRPVVQMPETPSQGLKKIGIAEIPTGDVPPPYGDQPVVSAAQGNTSEVEVLKKVTPPMPQVKKARGRPKRVQ